MGSLPEYLLGIINDILDLSKVEAGKMSAEQTTCEPCKIMAEVGSAVRVKAGGKGLAFDVEYLGAIPETIQTDPTRLRQILIDLIGNAIKFTEVGAVPLTAHAMSTERDKCLAAWSDEFAAKPIKQAALLDRVARHAPGAFQPARKRHQSPHAQARRFASPSGIIGRPG